MTLGRIDANDPTILTIRQTAARQTPVSPERNFGEVLAAGGRALLQGATSAASLLPGGNLIAAAVRGVGAAAPGALGDASTGSGSALLGGNVLGTSGTGAAADGPTVDGATNVAATSDGDMLARSQDMSMRMLQLQESMAEENRRYTALSNVLKDRHEMAKNAISNIR